MKKFLILIKKHKVSAGIFLLIIGSILYYAYSKTTVEGGDLESQSRVQEVLRGNIKIVINGSGQVQAESQVDLKPQIAGDGLDVVEVLVENNQLVKKGDIIVILDSSDEESNIRDSQLNVSSAQIQYDEVAREFDNKTLEETWKRDSAQNSLNQKMNQLNDAYEDLEDYKIESPFDGIVTGLNVEVGDSISRDEILASIITEKLQAEISLNELDAVKVKEGLPAILTFNALGDQEFEGEVLKIDTIGDVNSGVVSYDVVISFETSNEFLKPGMSVDVDIEIENAEDVLLLPVSAIKEDRKGNEYVLVVDSGYAINPESNELEKRILETGITDNISLEVVGGLAEGELILIENIATESNQNNAKKTNSLIPMGSPRGGHK